VEIAYPMLTNAVTNFSLSVPPGQKLRRTELRYFFKRALRGYLPDEILRKKKHGFGMPFGDWMLARPALAQLSDDALAGLAQRGYVRPEFIDELRKAMATSHPGYYGTMVWILTILELWFREHVPDARCE
jgi:asparagine synthase (glutamine-hydrolysing)